MSNGPEDLLCMISIDNPEDKLSVLDSKLVHYLELLDEYTKLTETYKTNFQEGFINLSRANYCSYKRFDKDSYDHRELNPVINIKYNNKQYTEINNLKSRAVAKEKEQVPFAEKLVESSSESESEIIDEKEELLRNRKTKPADSNTQTTKIHIPATPSSKSTYRDPLNMFGAMVPYQLRDSQKFFKHALSDSIRLVNLRLEIALVYKELKAAKKEKLKQSK